MKTSRRLIFFVVTCWILTACQPAPTTAVPETMTFTPLPPTETPTPTLSPVPPTATNTPFIPKATIYIAIAIPLTGDFANLGIDILNASELAVENLSHPLEILGYDIEIVPFDDKYDLDTAVNNAKTLVTDSTILCGVGHLNSTLTIQAGKIYHRAGLPFISPSTTNPDVTSSGYLEINRTIGREDGRGNAGAKFAQEQGFKAIYLVYHNDPYTFRNAQYFRNAAQILDLPLVGDIATNSSNGFNSIISAIMEKNTDMIYFSGLTEQVGNFISEARDLGYLGAFLGIDGISSPSVLSLAGPLALDGGGLYFTDYTFDVISMPNGALFSLDYQARFGIEPLPFAPFAYDAAAICMKAIEAAVISRSGEIPTRAEVASAIRALVDFQGIANTYNFTKNGDPLISHYQVFKITSIDPNKWWENPVVASYAIEVPGE